ncbi:hypothetical protein [Streptomyces sp. HYC2]|uniref:hypothetical protein n=1 Tax=Streptomyces sp. HYC2 TaxID=2955207 RepID=UPI00248100B5|nr:hypothetical protein [Streptomyces sp. HYC2]
MIIPIRVPADAAIHTEGGIRQLSPEHPLFGTLCPACGSHLEDQPITLVFVGTHPEDWKASGWMTGAAVAVHATCAGVPTTPVDEATFVAMPSPGANGSASLVAGTSTDWAALRDRIAETMARADGWEWAAANFSSLSTPAADRYRRCAEAVLAVLPAPAEQRAADLRWAADRIAALPQDCKPGRCPGESPKLLRRLADEAQPAQGLAAAQQSTETAAAGEEPTTDQIGNDNEPAAEGARRVRKAGVAAFLVDQGHAYSEPGAGDWDPGIRVTQAGSRTVYVFWEGLGEADKLATITGQLREAGYHVHATQQEHDGRGRLEVTLP